MLFAFNYIEISFSEMRERNIKIQYWTSSRVHYVVVGTPANPIRYYYITSFIIPPREVSPSSRITVFYSVFTQRKSDSSANARIIELSQHDIVPRNKNRFFFFHSLPATSSRALVSRTTLYRPVRQTKDKCRETISLSDQVPPTAVLYTVIKNVYTRLVDDGTPRAGEWMYLPWTS